MILRLLQAGARGISSCVAGMRKWRTCALTSLLSTEHTFPLSSTTTCAQSMGPQQHGLRFSVMRLIVCFVHIVLNLSMLQGKRPQVSCHGGHSCKVCSHKLFAWAVVVFQLLHAAA
ncbi:unnamed protein product [Durusdinium trenchii]|uniref:Secreted protein n=1 Tax=Durusdinium trenchii TaxID=1381693 RepID=A0ABP0QTN3_9DINO